MGKFNWKNVTREHVIKAIELFLKDNPEYPSPRSTFLIYDGKKLPAKHIRGMAYKIANNIEISKNDYSGGIETARFFEKLGFEIYYTNVAKTARKQQAKTPKPKELSIIDALPIEQSQISEIQDENDRLTKSEDKIKIPTKEVIEQKNALQLILNKMFNGDIVSEKTYSWLKTPSEINGEYKALYDSLSNYRGDTKFAKANVILRCDFVCESQKIIIEYDERQHFSEARRLSLESYRTTPVFYDRELWIKACQDIQAKDNQPINRDEIRAYYDSTRDIEAQKHGYTLVRIMHGQIDFTQNDAAEKLKNLLQQSHQVNVYDLSKIKIAMYLQTEQCQNRAEFNKAMALVKKSDTDILVFPEFCWVPFRKLLDESDIANEDDVNRIYDACLDLSRQIGKALIICSCDGFGTIFSVYANGNATGNETVCSSYIKHTMTSYSAFDFDNYPLLAKELFTPIMYKDHWIGMTICYDCNHALFSRMYGVQGVDIIINSTGGNVVYDKWYKYNQSRSIENHCYSFVTMGGSCEKDNLNSYVYGFNPEGKELHPHLINGHSNATNISGGIYIYDLADDNGASAPEKSLNQNKSINKCKDFYIPVGKISCLLENAIKVDNNLFVLKFQDTNIVFILTENDDIFMAERFLPLMYSDKLQKYPDRRYVLVCQYNNLDINYYNNYLSVVLKVRAMENFCAVILESNIINNCYQAGKCKNAQVIKEENGNYGLDLSRMTGAEAIWKDKGTSFKASWRDNFVWLANKCKYISDNNVWEKLL